MSLRRVKIVIIEDEAFLSKALYDGLSSAECEILSASDGESGLKIIQKQKPDLVLLDIILPKMNGFDVLVSLKKYKNTKGIPVIMLSNLDRDEDRKKGIELGAIQYIVKSDIELEELSKIIKRYLS
ncbi:response regulator [Candidatus Parcubacteria bacterium]|jgi:two-component system, OmpR family, alkaline phosphatase synthesis response regulator PhoP|nr:response regulator [Candidatus Parcubacteria bacterium]MBT3949155.1 response regulator [Candidatus Parcubacteria bacterium]